MSDVYEPENRNAHAQLVELFLRRTQAEVEQVRRSVPQLIAGEDAAWRDLCVMAQRIAGMAAGLGLGVLSDCARELHKLGEERFDRVSVDPQFLLSVTIAIEMIAIELHELFAAGYRR